MIFLRDNVLLERELSLQDIKPRLLGELLSHAALHEISESCNTNPGPIGHWGTCPGIILVWSHLNVLIQRHNIETIFVIGPGHGAPAALAALWLEGSLERFYPKEYPRSREGLRNLVTRFSVPGGFPRWVWETTAQPPVV